MVREGVVPFGDADLGERPVAAVVGQDQGGHAGRVGLEGQDHHVGHQADVVPVRGGDAARGVDRRGRGRVADLLGLLDAGLDLADAGQVLVELGPVLRVARAPWRSRASSRTKSRIDFCCSAGGSRKFFRRSPAGPEPKRRSKTRPGVGLGGHRGGRGPPRHVPVVGARVPRVAPARLPDAVAGQLQRGEPREVADVPGDELVDRDAGADVGARGLLDPDPGQERAAGPGVVAAAVACRRWRAGGPARRGPGSCP